MKSHRLISESIRVSKEPFIRANQSVAPLMGDVSVSLVFGLTADANGGISNSALLTRKLLRAWLNRHIANSRYVTPSELMPSIEIKRGIKGIKGDLNYGS
jgi:hypothetical protein